MPIKTGLPCSTKTISSQEVMGWITENIPKKDSSVTERTLSRHKEGSSRLESYASILILYCVPTNCKNCIKRFGCLSDITTQEPIKLVGCSRFIANSDFSGIVKKMEEILGEPDLTTFCNEKRLSVVWHNLLERERNIFMKVKITDKNHEPRNY